MKALKVTKARFDSAKDSLSWLSVFELAMDLIGKHSIIRLTQPHQIYKPSPLRHLYEETH